MAASPARFAPVARPAVAMLARTWPEAFAGVAPGNDVDVMDDLDRLLRTEPPDRAPRTRRWAVSERRPGRNSR